MTLTPESGAGLAEMTYAADGGREQNVSGAATTTVWYEGGQPAVAYMKLSFPALYVAFGIDPFTGAGQYSELPYFVYLDPSVLGPDCHGLWTTPADGPAPILDVTSFTVSSSVTVWASTLTAELTWFVEDCRQPPLSLRVTTLTLTIHHQPSSGTAAEEPATALREQAAQLARQFGVSSFPS